MSTKQITEQPFSVLPKHGSFVQSWRKPVSRAVALFLFFGSVFTLPRGFGTGWHEWIELVGFIFLVAAGNGRIWCLVYIAGNKNRHLCQDGPYSLTRNPLYFFSFLGLLGFCLAIQNVLLGFAGCATYLIYYNAVIRGEETRLRLLHGDEFDAYCARVPRFFPRPVVPTRRATLIVNMGPFTRGLRDMFWFPAVIVYVEILERAHLRKLWSVIVLPF